MEKIGTKTIEVNPWKKEEFDVFPCNCKIGDTVWFDDGIPDEDGTIDTHNYMKGKVTAIDPEHWWIYDGGKKVLGNITVKVEDDEFYAGQNFSVAFKDIIYEEPNEVVIENAMISFKVAKALKDAGYPQKDYGHHYSKTGSQLYGAIWDSDIYIPEYSDVWIWLWRKKKIQIHIIPMFGLSCGLVIWKSDERIYCKFKFNDPEEAVIAAIDYLVDNDLIK